MCSSDLGWDFGSDNSRYRIARVAADDAPEGKQVLAISRRTDSSPMLFAARANAGEVTKVPLPGGGTAYVPLSLSVKDSIALKSGDALESRPRKDDPLPLEVRVADIVVAWNVFRHFAPNLPASLDWDRELERAIAAEVGVPRRSRDEHRDALRRLLAPTRDGHVQVRDRAAPPTGFLPANFRVAEGRIVVTGVAEGSPLRIGDVIERMLPKGKPTLILFDELMNYVNRSRKSGLAAQFYTFLHNLSEVARARDNVVLAVSIPASELEMTTEDHQDFDRLKKLLDRLGKAIIMSAEAETSEIIRRRLFEWQGLPKDALSTIEEYEHWLLANKQQLPSWFPVENAREALKASYPFHPSLLSVFERKWQGLPRFQQTRGVLRLLALWVSKAYSEGYKGAHKDPLISLGTAPLEDPLFRAALFEQLGEARLEPAVTTDIAGKDHAHALRLDTEATKELKSARLHRKVATTILFESNGGQQRGEATLPEVRLAVAEPELDIGSVEQCLEALTDSCYFLAAEKNRYRFSFQPNLNKLLADRRASVSAASIDDVVRKEIQKVFGSGTGIERVYFPKKSNDVPDRALLTLVVLSPDNTAPEPSTKSLIAQMTTESGSSSRTFKSALIWVAPEDASSLLEEARKLLAWKDIDADSGELKLDETQQRQLTENTKRAERDLRESVWRAYKNVFLLADDNSMRKIDLGLVHSSAANSLVELILTRLRQEDIVVEGVSPNFLTRYWPPALPEWSTKSVRDAFYASPKFPRLLKADAVKDTISRGLDAGTVAYVGRSSDGSYEPFVYKRSLSSGDIEIADDVYLIVRERADQASERGFDVGSDGGTDVHDASMRCVGGLQDDGTNARIRATTYRWYTSATRACSNAWSSDDAPEATISTIGPTSGTEPRPATERQAKARAVHGNSR